MVKLIQALAGITAILTFIFLFLPQIRSNWNKTNKENISTSPVDNHIAITTNKSETVKKRAKPKSEQSKKEVEQKPTGTKVAENKSVDKKIKISAEEFGVKINGGICRVHIENRSNLYMLIKIYSHVADNIVRNVFIPSGESYTIAGIPEGNYFIKYSYGNEWDQVNKKLISIIDLGHYNSLNILNLAPKDKKKLRDGKIVWYKECEEKFIVVNGRAFKTSSPQESQR